MWLIFFLTLPKKVTRCRRFAILTNNIFYKFFLKINALPIADSKKNLNFAP